MKKINLILSVFAIGFGFIAFSQNVGIGTATPAASAKLHIVDANRGLLIPNVALVNVTNGLAPVAAPATSLLVYNTNAAVVGGSGTGYYYWDGASWVRLSTGPTSWSILGNAGTAPATNFIGTTDNQSFVVRTNNAERMRVLNTGNIGIGTATPITPLEVSSGATSDAIYGHSNNVGGVLGREGNITFGVPAQTLQGAGVYANNPAAGYTSSYAQSTGAATVAANISYSDVWMATYNLVQNGSATFNPSSGYSQLNVTNATLGGFQSAVRGYNDRGTTAGNPGYTVGGQFTSNTQTQDAFAVVGQAYTNSTTRAGGYFESNNYAGTNQAFAYVGSTVGLARKITGTNAVSEIVPTANHGRVTLTAPESPEYWYQDYGTVELVNGRAHVDLDPILAEIIVVDATNPIRAFFTPQDLLYFNGVAVVNQTATGFDIVELNGGTNSGKIQYQIIVRPKTGYGEGRFPQAPGPAYVKSDKEPASAKAANQVDPTKIFYWPADHEVYGYDPEEMVEIGDVIPAGPNVGKIKLGNGEYGNGVPSERPERK